MSDKTDWSASILKYIYRISSFFRFSMSLHEPSDFCLVNICDMYSPVSCTHFVITPIAESFWISKFRTDFSFEKLGI